MSGFVYDSVPMAFGGGDQNGHGRPQAKNSVGESPLKLFVLAKRDINDVFNDISSYVEESRLFLRPGRETINDEKITAVGELSSMVTGIKEVLVRDNMKVAFFGRTSNGKSSVINAVLNNKILPSGMGHTTNCFLSGTIYLRQV